MAPACPTGAFTAAPACRGGDLTVAAYLVDHGANPYAMGHDGKTAYDAAAAAGHEAVVTWLRATQR